MKDKEIVRMAYRLILGREPEEVLDWSFENIYRLRDEFINSFEFLNWWSIKLKLIESGKFQIIYINTPHFILLGCR